MSCHGESIASLTCQMSIMSLHTIPTVAQQAVDGAEEGHQSNYPNQYKVRYQKSRESMNK